jgi:hypothetical protein
MSFFDLSSTGNGWQADFAKGFSQPITFLEKGAGSVIRSTLGTVFESTLGPNYEYYLMGAGVIALIILLK